MSETEQEEYESEIEALISENHSLREAVSGIRASVSLHYKQDLERVLSSLKEAQAVIEAALNRR